MAPAQLTFEELSSLWGFCSWISWVVPGEVGSPFLVLGCVPFLATPHRITWVWCHWVPSSPSFSFREEFSVPWILVCSLCCLLCVLLICIMSSSSCNCLSPKSCLPHSSRMLTSGVGRTSALCPAFRQGEAYCGWTCIDSSFTSVGVSLGNCIPFKGDERNGRGTHNPCVNWIILVLVVLRSFFCCNSRLESVDHAFHYVLFEGDVIGDLVPTAI